MFYIWLYWQLEAGKNWNMSLFSPTGQIVVSHWVRQPLQICVGVTKYPPYHWTQF